MANKGRTGHSTITPLAVIISCVICLILGIVPSLLYQIIDFSLGLSIVAALGLLAYAVTTTLYTKRFSFFSMGALLAGALFYASSVIRYTFGGYSANFSLSALLSFQRGVSANQKSHGIAMLVLGLGMALAAVRRLTFLKERKHADNTA